MVDNKSIFLEGLGCLRMSDDGRFLYAATAFTISKFRLEGNDLVYEATGPAGAVDQYGISADGRTLAMGGGTGSKGLILVDTAKMTGRDLPIMATPGWVEFDPTSDDLVVPTPQGIALFDHDGTLRDRLPGLATVQRLVAHPRGGEYLVWSDQEAPLIYRRVKK